MKKIKIVIPVLVVLTMMISCTSVEKKVDFVKVEEGVFYVGEDVYRFAGTNYWQGMHLGSTKYGDREQLKRELDQLKSFGITNLRIMASSEADDDSKFCMHPPLQKAPGVYDENLWEGLDFLLAEMGKRDMKAVMVLSNFWSWSGGFSQYLKWAGLGEIPYPQLDEYSWWDFGNYTKDFFSNEKCLEWYNNHVKNVVYRKNSITQELYKSDATIMAWQLANEPRGYVNKEDFQKWIKNTSEMIKSMDENHLVSLGSEGNTPSLNEGLDALVDNAYDGIDYITMHIWVQNWNWYTPGQGDDAYNEMIKKVDAYWSDHVKISQQLNKPLVLEEYGLARDGFSYDVNASTGERDKYYGYIYQKFVDNAIQTGAVQGVNFWSYSGEARPNHTGGYWEKGDDFVGDPPHELQGWYGVYDADITTFAIIKEKLSVLNK